MRNHDHRPRTSQTLDCGLNEGLGSRIRVSGCLVEDEHRRVRDNRPRDGHALRLTTGKGHVDVDHRIQALRQRRDDRIEVRELRGRHDFAVGGVSPGQPDVLPQGQREQLRILEHHRHRTVHVAHGDVAKIVAAQQHRAFDRVVETCQQPGDGGLSGTGGPHQRREGPRFERRGHPVEDPRPIPVGEDQVPNLERASVHGHRLGGLGDRRRAQHLRDGLQGGDPRDDGFGVHSHPHDRRGESKAENQPGDETLRFAARGVPQSEASAAHHCEDRDRGRHHVDEPEIDVRLPGPGGPRADERRRRGIVAARALAGASEGLHHRDAAHQLDDRSRHFFRGSLVVALKTGSARNHHAHQGEGDQHRDDRHRRDPPIDRDERDEGKQGNQHRHHGLTDGVAHELVDSRDVLLNRLDDSRRAPGVQPAQR